MTNPSAHINYSFADIERYLNGGMTTKEMHDMERAALQDPFLADAIEGYQNADRNIAEQHLNEVVAALQKEQPAKVIPLPKKKRYSWLIAASLLAMIGTGIFLFRGENNSKKVLAENTSQKNLQTDSFTGKPNQSAPKQEPDAAIARDNLALIKPQEKENNQAATRQLKKPSPTEESTAAPAPPQQEPPQVAMTYAAPQGDSRMIIEQKQLAPSLPDSMANGSLSEATAGYYGKQRAKKLANTWTTDKGKPFLLSEVEVINIGKKDRKKGDTLSIKPEGGWQSFQDYLFSRLSRHDSLALINNNWISGNLELEFSVDKTGSPYDVKVLHAQDTILSNKIANAVQSGPKWTGSDSKEKRLHLRY